MTVRVLIVDGSQASRDAMFRAIAGAPGFEVVGTAKNGDEALSLVERLRPSIVTIEARLGSEDGVELARPGNPASLCLFQTDEKPAHLHLAFVAEHRGQVDAFHRAALEAGARDHGAPGLRPQYSGTYYAAFVIGPDGHNIEVVCHEEDRHA